ncbi:hypothetical protein ACRQ1B_22910 [Rhizobium panacihumi]|uniref:hypothetical protein n=1 Tax=Rhizobium panacihumi TaxID=2008450 RepID=UPI003D7A3035
MWLNEFWQQKRVRVSVKVGLLAALVVLAIAFQRFTINGLPLAVAAGAGAIGFALGGIMREGIGQPGVRGGLKAAWTSLLFLLMTTCLTGLFVVPPIGLVLAPFALADALVRDPKVLVSLLAMASAIHLSERRWPAENEA